MAKCNTKAGRRLRQLKNHYEQQVRQLKEDFDDQLFAFEHSLQQQLHSHAFYHEALMNLLTSENEPDSDLLIGAVVTQRWIRESGQSLHQQLHHLRLSILLADVKQ